MSKQNIEFKDSGIPWIGEIPKHWEISKIKYVANLFTGNSISDSQKDNFTNSENSLPYIATKDIELDTNLVNYKNGMYIPKLNSSFKIAPKNSILLCIEGGSAGRKISFINKDVCFVNKLCCFVAKPDFSKKFLYYYCQNPSFISEFKLNLIGLIGGVSINSIKNFKIPLPPLNEQKEIAEFLDKKCEIIDKRLSNLERKIKSLKEYKKTLISECVTKGLNPKNMEFKDSGIPWCPQIPSDWQVINPKILFKQRNQKAKSGEIQYTASQEFGIISQEEYTRKTGYNMVKVLKGFDILKHVEVGDFVISMRSFQGGLEYSNVSGSISSAYVMLIPNSKFVNNRYFRWLFKSSKYIDALQSTTNLIRDGQAMRYSNFALIKLIVPSLNEQKEIAEFLDKKCEKIDRLNENYTKQITALKEYKKSLIYECVTGKNI
ncbi:MAG: restriction endonuclease subunit S [Campylobacter lanienae]|uniref:restriction endonuclease subunit S n=1 Tax=Campylobacter lanienae TaxID=75658 RepID=UPI00242C1ECC|nr:restriction endonuclease subunit S [Campylobacter lanienae]MCI7363475.1 restriction endonuclease subunit S [Campylobacter lanienae]